jgi:predicted RNase H-like HicB family nuclease
MKAYTVLYERGERNWSAYVPDLPGCVATGKTREETEQRIREAISFHIEGLKIDGEPTPEPTIESLFQKGPVRASGGRQPPVR